MTLRAGFLIVAAALVLHASYWQTVFVLVGYFGFGLLDQWLDNRATERVIDYEVSGWAADADGSEWESNGSMSRVRLPQNEQIVVTRVAELLRRIR